MKNALFISGAMFSLIFSLLTGCSSIRVTTDYQPEYNFNLMSSYAIIKPSLASLPPQAQTSMVKERVNQALQSSLNARGYREKPRDQANMLVTYMITTSNKQDVRAYNNHYGYARCWSCRTTSTTVTVTDYTEGTLIIDIIDPASQKVVWRGFSTKRLSKSRTPEERQQVVREVINAILAEFPPTS